MMEEQPRANEGGGLLGHLLAEKNQLSLHTESKEKMGIIRKREVNGGY